jgi:hypothetical protein
MRSNYDSTVGSVSDSATRIPIGLSIGYGKQIEKLIFTEILKSSIPSITKSRLTDVKPHAKNSIWNETAKKK